MYGWKARIGLITPMPGENVEHAFHIYAPPGVSFSSMKMVFPGPTPEGLASRNLRLTYEARMAPVNAAAAVCAALTANWIVFRLRGPALLLYVCVSAMSGTLCGLLGAAVARRLAPVVAACLPRNTRSVEETK